MATENRYGELGSYAERLIKRKAAEIVKLEGFTPSGLEDIEQDLAFEILRRRPDFDPERSSYETFVTRVVNHAMTDMVDKCWAPKRNPRRCECSLNELIPDSEGGLVERAETLDHETYRRSSAPHTEQELQDLHLDLEDALGSLPPKLRRICDLLAEGKSLPEIARLTSIPQRTIYRARDKIRKHFEHTGLGEYVGRTCGKISKRSGT